MQGSVVGDSDYKYVRDHLPAGLSPSDSVAGGPRRRRALRPFTVSFGEQIETAKQQRNRARFARGQSADARGAASAVRARSTSRARKVKN
jgi:hypothetical protein